MSYNVETINEFTKSLDFQFEKVDIKDMIENTLKEKQRDAEVKGFRKGKAPMGLIRQVYGPKAKSDAITKFIQTRLFEALKEEKLNPIGVPSLAESNFDDENNKITFKVILETFPEFECAPIDNLSFEQKKVDLKQEEIDQTLDSYLSSKASIEPVTDENHLLENGNIAIFNFEGERANGERPDNMKAKDYQLEIGSNSFIPGFEEGLIGLKKGAKKTLNLIFPEDYHQEDLKNENVKFDVEILEIKEKKKPILDDELAKEFGGENKEDFLNKIEKNLKFQKERQSREKLQQDILNKLVELNTFDVPDSLIQEQKKYLKNDLEKNLKAQGLGEEFIKSYYKKWDVDLNDKAIFQIKTGLIMEKLAKNFQIDIGPEEIEKKYKELSEQTGMKLDDVKKYYEGQKEGKNNLIYSLREEKTFDKILEKAKLKTVD